MQLVFSIIAAIGMHGVAFFDMGNYPLTHEMVCAEEVVNRSV